MSLWGRRYTAMECMWKVVWRKWWCYRGAGCNDEFLVNFSTLVALEVFVERYCHIDDIFVTDFTGSGHFDHFWCSWCRTADITTFLFQCVPLSFQVPCPFEVPLIPSQWRPLQPMDPPRTASTLTRRRSHAQDLQVLLQQAKMAPMDLSMMCPPFWISKGSSQNTVSIGTSGGQCITWARTWG